MACIGTDQELTALARRTREELLEQMEDRLRAFLRAEHELWAEVNERAVGAVAALTDLVAAGGKRIRPAFCIAGYLAAGGDPDDTAVVAAAAALEMLHASALIHDDVIDASSHRRGRPTVHARHSALHDRNAWQGESRRYGEGVAILVGDLALVYSEQLMAAAPPAVLPVWGTLRSELMIGQYMDMTAAAEFLVDPRLSRWIALAKSGHYTIHRPLVVGASAAGRADLAPAFAKYGEAVGEAFQLRDDLLDAFGDFAHTGKPAGLDFSQHKMTLLLSWAMQRDARIHSLITEPGHTPDEVRRRLVDTGVPDDVEKHIAGLVEQGCEAIADVPIDPVWRTELTTMATQAAYRTT
uniref:Putative trans-polyprenyl diphosphate synthetase n=1 Tax=Streptomyces virginiae TaxID=1961 RepID=A2AXG2_STRVG|nr:putative trans-polyprenyl diphosphate synthetase [Streptomyces virginiae]